MMNLTSKLKIFKPRLPNFCTSEIENLPKSIALKQNKPPSLYLLSKDIANKFASKVNLSKTNSFIMEVNPGPGYLTEALIMASGVERIHVYEKMGEFQPQLTLLSQKYPRQIDIRPYNFLTIYNIEHKDVHNSSNAMENVVEGIEKRSWEDEPALTIIGSISKPNFFNYLQLSISHGFFSNYGRIVFYVALLPSMSKSFQDTINMKALHRAKNIHLQTLMKYQLLDILPRDVFYPRPSQTGARSKNMDYYQEDNEHMHLCKLEFNQDLFNNEFTRTDFLYFYYFLAIHMRRRDTRVIPSLEKWIPNCGPRLIKLNYTIYTLFSELSAAALFNLFKTFKSWPEYETSLFIEIVKSTLARQMSAQE